MSTSKTEAISKSQLIRLKVTSEDAALRLDQLLTARIADHTRSQLQRLIKEGRAYVGSKQGRASSVVRKGEVVTLEIPPPHPSSLDCV